MSTRTSKRAAAPAALPPIKVLPIPEHRPPALPADIPIEALGTGYERSMTYVQDALAFELMPRRSDVERAVAPTDLPDPHAWIGGIAQALLEVMLGLRPPSQVVRSCAPEVYLAVARRHASASRRRENAATKMRRPTVAKVHSTRPDETVTESVVLVLAGPRVRAMALRAEAGRTGWRVTALELG